MKSITVAIRIIPQISLLISATIMDSDVFCIYGASCPCMIKKELIEWFKVSFVYRADSPR